MKRPITPYVGDEPYLFVSYAHSNAAQVYPELEWLDLSGFRVWYDEGIRPSRSWSDEIAAAISGCKALLLFMTPEACASEHCVAEVNFALDRQKPLLVVRLAPTDGAGGLELRLAAIQAILAHELPTEQYHGKLRRAIQALLDGETHSPPASNLPAAAAAPPLVAVLPFVSLSATPDDAYLADGIAEDILNAMARASTLRVIARTSSFQFRGSEHSISDVGTLLGASHVLEGSVRRAGQRIRVTAQLISCVSSTPVWGERYDRLDTDLFSLQDEIAAQIVRSVSDQLLEPQTVRTHGTTNYDAYEHYLKAGALASSGLPDDMPAAEASYRAALALDPGFADAWFALGRHALRMMNDPVALLVPAEAFARARAAFERALAIDPEHAGASGWLAYVALNADYDWDEGIRLFERALELNPTEASVRARYGWFLNVLRRPEGREQMERAFQLDPLSIDTIYMRAIQLVVDRRYGECRRLIETLLIHHPNSYLTHWYLGYFYALLNDWAGAREQLRRCQTIVGDDHPCLLYLKAKIAELAGDEEATRAAQLAIRAHLDAGGAVPLFLDLWWPPEEQAEMFEIAYEHRMTCLQIWMMQLRPAGIDKATWEELKARIHFDRMKTGRVLPRWIASPEQYTERAAMAGRLDDARLAEFAGEYFMPHAPGRHIFFEVNGDGFLSFRDRTSRGAFVWIEGDVFQSVLSNYQARFQRDGEGRVVGVRNVIGEDADVFERVL